ncbi:MAG TPA: HAMP domain-containing protein [Bacteroides sp.]|nr:HAMP domain-containing protein [Bacteroides sp.]
MFRIRSFMRIEMSGSFRRFFRKITFREMIERYHQFRSSIYGRVVFIIAGSFIILLVLFNIIFRSVYVDFFNVTVRQNGDHISSIVEGALYYSMLENDRGMLQRTLDVISTMSGIDEVNMYDEEDQLSFTSVSGGIEHRGNPNCGDCHADLASIFSYSEQSYRIVEDISGCGISRDTGSSRHLLIRKPILNEPSCYTAACHAHGAGDEVLGALLINLPLDDMDAFVNESSTDFLLLATLTVVFLITFLVIFTRRRIKDPLNSIIRASEAVSRGDNSIRLEIKPDLLNDMRKVSLAFNNMLDNIDTAARELHNWSQQLEYKVRKKTEELSEVQNELIHVERIASLGKLSSSVAHEINNPLSGILVYTKLIHKQLDRDAFRHPKKSDILKNLKYIEHETKRCGEIVKGLLDFSRKEWDDFEVIHLHRLLDETYDLMTHSVKIADIRFAADYKAEQDQIFCSPNQIKQACMALIVNAAEAIHDHGEIVITTGNPDPAHVSVVVSDNGSGIAPQDLPHVFEPFFSTKRDANGIGLGLPIVHGIVENHKGRIEVESRAGMGTTMTMTFPLSGKQ